MNMVCILESFLLHLVLRLGSILGAQSFSSLSPLMDSVLKTSLEVYFRAILSGNVGGEKKQDNKSDKKKAQEVASSEDEDEDMNEDESEGQEVDDED